MKLELLDPNAPTLLFKPFISIGGSLCIKIIYPANGTEHDFIFVDEFGRIEITELALGNFSTKYYSSSTVQK